MGTPYISSQIVKQQQHAPCILDYPLSSKNDRQVSLMWLDHSSPPFIIIIKMERKICLATRDHRQTTNFVGLLQVHTLVNVYLVGLIPR